MSAQPIDTLQPSAATEQQKRFEPTQNPDESAVQSMGQPKQEEHTCGTPDTGCVSGSHA